MENLFIARQAIYDRNLKVMGYELLYRNSESNSATFTDHTQATCDTIINSFMNIGIERLVGSAQAFINLPEAFITDEKLTPVLKEQSILEIMDNIKPSSKLINGLERLKSNNFKIALDGFSFSEDKIPFLLLADYVKIDINNKSESDIRQQLKQLSQYELKLIAQKVESHELYTFCRDLDFDFFQGFFFSQPQIIRQKNVPSNKLVIIKLLNKLQNPELNFEELESILAQDVGLSYKLLRYINSAAFALRNEVHSIKEAIILLGIQNIKNWISLILMTKVIDAKPSELIATALVRGKMCELLAERYNPELTPNMFIIGLFSVLDTIMDTPMDELLDTVTLSSPVKMALLDQQGEAGEIYQHVLHYEHFKWKELDKSIIDNHIFTEDYIAAVEWANKSIMALLN